MQPLYSRTSILHHIPPASYSAVELQQPVLRLFFLTFTPRYQYRSTHMHSSHFSASLLFRTNSTLGKISGTESWARPTTLVPPAVPPRPQDGTVSVIVLFTIVFSCMTDCNLTFNTVRCLWRCLSYRGSAGGYLFIECRGVAALQMRSSQ